MININDPTHAGCLVMLAGLIWFFLELLCNQDVFEPHRRSIWAAWVIIAGWIILLIGGLTKLAEYFSFPRFF